jgi:hypothetical protein
MLNWGREECTKKERNRERALKETSGFWTIERKEKGNVFDRLCD